MTMNVNVWLKDAYPDNLKHVPFIVTKIKSQYLNILIKIPGMTQTVSAHLQGPETPNEEVRG